ncbi:agarase [Catenovulum sediminis]|uniref:agarase n=1 Tax=Catenovulum sediminis TaxID=1740262 RepID=UPI00117D0053|nr:agarase [Catenovulum sediminis]
MRKLPIAAMLSAILLTACDNNSSQTQNTEVTASQPLAVIWNGTESAGVKIGSWGAETKLTNNGVKVDYQSDHYRPSVKFHPEKPWDWSNYSEFNIAVDIKNLSDESVQVYISLTDEAGVKEDMEITGSRARSLTRAVNLGKGEEGTYFLIIEGKFVDTDAGIREKPLPWQTDEEMFVTRFGKKVDLSRITEVAFFVRGNLSDKQIEINNIRLRANPEYNKDYLRNLVDKFGQNAKQDYPHKIDDLKELKNAANQELAELKSGGLMADRSRFGGWKNGPKLESTGYFRVEKIDGRWWMVDPDGYLFFSHGPANVRMANLTTLTGIDFKDEKVRYIDPTRVTPEDSVGIVSVSDEIRKTKYVSSELRHNMFTWLPDYDDPMAKHYSYRREVHKGPLKSGETFSFYRANLERRYGDNFEEKWQQVTLDRMNNWGFTSFGNWVDPAFYPNQQVPYFANGWIIGDFKTLSSEHDVWAPLPDPFDPEFARRAKITIDVIAEEIKGSPWCAGIFIDNEKSWGMPEGTIDQRYGVIISTLARSDADSPTKAHFTEYLKGKHNSIEQFNKAWGLDLANWQAVSQGVKLSAPYTDALTADLSYMLESLSDQYFKVVHDTLEKALPNHLYMGARMANFGMPKETIKASVTYSDVLSFNIYEEGVQPEEWGFLTEIDLPVVIGEFHIGSTTDAGLFHAGLVQSDNQADRAQMYLDYMHSVVAHPNFVGAHWFQYIDSPITGRAFDGEPYNVGFVSTTDIPYPHMVDAIKDFMGDIYPKRFKGEFDSPEYK